MKHENGIYTLTDHELGCLGETMVELSNLVYGRIYPIVEDYTRVAIIIRGAAINFEQEGIWDEEKEDYITCLERYADKVVEETVKEYTDPFPITEEVIQTPAEPKRHPAEMTDEFDFILGNKEE